MNPDCARPPAPSSKCMFGHAVSLVLGSVGFIVGLFLWLQVEGVWVKALSVDGKFK